MAAVGANLTVLGAAALAIPARGRLASIARELAATASFTFCFLLLTGAVFQSGPFFGIATGQKPSPASVVLLLLSALAILSARPDGPILTLLSDQGPAGILSRSLLPVPLILPVLSGIARTAGQYLGLIKPDTGPWLFTLMNIFAAILIVWRSGTVLFRADRLRRIAEGEVWRSRDDLERRVELRTRELVDANTRLQAEVEEREKAERDLQRINATLSAMIDGSPLGICVFNPDGTIRKRNAAAALIPNDSEEIRKLIDKARRGQGTASADLTVASPTGPAHLNVWAAPLRSSDDQLDSILVMIADVSERRALESQLRQSEKMGAVGRLAGGVAHDFNNLLTAILGLSDLLIDTFEAGDQRREEVQEIHRAGERAADLTKRLLAFSRNQIAQPRVLDLNGVVHDLERMLWRLIGEDIDLATELDPRLHRIMLDRGQIEMVLINLVVNSRDAMPKGGRLLIHTANVNITSSEKLDHPVPPGSYVMLGVTDTGSGMDAETRVRIFEPFFTTKPAGEGTGLGLSTVYGVLQQNHGAIEVETAPGKGASFRLYFPTVPDEQPRRTETSKTSAGSWPTGSETILLVEDEQSVRTLAQTVLQRCGYRILTAEDAPSALSQVEAHTLPIDLLLTDVVMPRMSGRELAETMASLQPKAKVLFMSGHMDDAILRHGVLTAEIPFLQKPFTPDVLAQKVRDVLDGG